MKRVIITILIFLFGIGCGFGAFFMLKTGGDMKREELKSVQKLEAQEVEKENVPNLGTNEGEEKDVPNFGTQEEKNTDYLSKEYALFPVNGLWLSDETKHHRRSVQSLST